MSNYNWCHGPNCHTSHTQDRIRGVKGSKVLRTRKIAINKWNENHFFRFFCSNGCYNDFARKHINEIIAIAPRTEALETPIDVVKETVQEGYWKGTVNTRIITVDNNGG
jgi:hypothetical protein